MDKERQVYKLKEASLAEVIALSLGIQKKTEAHDNLIYWRKSHGGVFSDTVQKVRAANNAALSRADAPRRAGGRVAEAASARAQLAPLGEGGERATSAPRAMRC